MDRGAWLATVHGVAESWTRLKWLSTHVHVTYITHPFSYCFPLWFIVGYWIRFPVLYSRTLLFIHSRYNSLHLLRRNQLSKPLKDLHLNFLISHLLAQSLSHVQLFATPWNAANQAPLSMGFSRQEYWSELPFPFPGGLPNPGIESVSLLFPALAGRFFTTEPPGEPR